MSKPIKRPLPMLTESNRFFWTSGADGRLRFMRCSACQNYIHPPVPVCDKCLSMEQEVVAVSGRATLAAVTVNHQMWIQKNHYEPMLRKAMKNYSQLEQEDDL